MGERAWCSSPVALVQQPNSEPAGDNSAPDVVIAGLPEHGLLDTMGGGIVMIGLKPLLGVKRDGTAPASTTTDVVTAGGGAVTIGLKPSLGVKPDGTAPASTTGPANVVPATGGTVIIGLKPPPDARSDGTAPALTGETAKVSPVDDWSNDETQAPVIPPDDEAPLASKAGAGPPISRPTVPLQVDAPVRPGFEAPGITAAAPSGIAEGKLVVGRIIGPIAPSGIVVGKLGEPIETDGETVLIARAPMAPKGVLEGAPWARLAPQLSERTIAAMRSKRIAVSVLCRRRVFERALAAAASVAPSHSTGCVSPT